MFDSSPAAAIQRQCQLRGSKKFKRYEPYEETMTLTTTTTTASAQTRDYQQVVHNKLNTPTQQDQKHCNNILTQTQNETMAKMGNILLKSANSEDQVPMNKSPSYQFLACFEDSSFLYRRRPRHKRTPSRLKSVQSAMHTSISSRSSSSTSSSSSSYMNFKTSSNTTGDSMLTPSSAFHSSDAESSVSSENSSSSSSTSCLLTSPFSTDSGASDVLKLVPKGNSSKGSDSSSLKNSSFAVGSSNYFEDERVFLNLVLKERTMQLEDSPKSQHLTGELRHLLLAWMLKVCEHQLCQDEIFALATQILEKFLHLNPLETTTNEMYFEENDNNNKTSGNTGENHDKTCGFYHSKSWSVDSNNNNEQEEHHDHEKHQFDPDELQRRQLILFAACSLLLATKFRQTQRLCVQTLIDFSRLELPIELSRDELLDGELLLLSALKWDLAGLITPNDFLAILARKCRPISLAANDQQQRDDEQSTVVAATKDSEQQDKQGMTTISNNNNENKLQQDAEWARVKRHTQTLLELCLMDSHLSQYSPSVLAMTTMAVAIDGLTMTAKSCSRLNNIVAQIHEATGKVNELNHMIDVAGQIEKYVQNLLHNNTPTTTTQHDD